MDYEKSVKIISVSKIISYEVDVLEESCVELRKNMVIGSSGGRPTVLIEQKIL